MLRNVIIRGLRKAVEQIEFSGEWWATASYRVGGKIDRLARSLEPICFDIVIEDHTVAMLQFHNLDEKTLDNWHEPITQHAYHFAMLHSKTKRSKRIPLTYSTLPMAA